MKNNKAHDILAHSFAQNIMYEHAVIRKLVYAIHESGGRCLLVGGAVRDSFCALPIKDIDIEVHNIDFDALEAILRTAGFVSTVGKSFGVLRVHGLDVDWSLPRSDSIGRKPVVHVDPFMPIQQAFRRRDVTINAMGIDLITGELIDPFNGFIDLGNYQLRAVDIDRFGEDPLRFFRVMHFIGRFSMYPDDELNALCSSMDISHVSRERIEIEFDKLLMKSSCPSRGFVWLRSIQRLSEVLPELAALINVPQKKKWHPEGDVFEHTMQALDAAAAQQYVSDQEKRIVLWAALCHDLGKPATTDVGPEGDFSCHLHPMEGSVVACTMMKRITHNIQLIDAVSVLVKHHMAPLKFSTDGARPVAYKRLARALAPHANIRMLMHVARADSLGRNRLKGTPLSGPVPVVDEFELIVNKLSLTEFPERAVLQGKDLLDVIEPGLLLGKLLKRAYDIQLEEGIQDKEELRRRVLAYKSKNI
jgi:tRNA nucleotidyltransferase (CCA-adding enzyme)